VENPKPSAAENPKPDATKNDQKATTTVAQSGTDAGTSPAAGTTNAGDTQKPAEQKPAETTKTEPATTEPAKTESESTAAAPTNSAETATKSEPATEPTEAALEASLPQADSLTAGQRVIHIWLGDSGQNVAAQRAFDDPNEGLKRKFAPLLDTYVLEVRQFAVASSNVHYYLYVGPVENLQKAQDLCNKIKQRDSGQMCRPVIN